MSLESQYEVKLTIDNKDFETWDRLEGGAVDSEERKYRPGGMAEQVSLGGSKTTGNLTLSRLYMLDRDHGLFLELVGKVGKGECKVVKQPLTSEGEPQGDPITYSGVLKSVTPPNHNSESDDAAMIEIEISTAGVPT
jgi:hypothetical protein